MSRPSPDEMSIRMDDLEYRPALEVRAVGDRIVGHALVFDVRSRDLGGFVEVIRPQAVDRSLAEIVYSNRQDNAGIVALYAHDPAAVLGRTPKTLSLTKDDRGVAFDLDPAPTQAGREALALVRRGDLTGASFGFRTMADRWLTEGTQTIREVLDVEIVEISLTAFPAYPQTNVEIAQRSRQAWQQSKGSDTTVARSIAWLRMRDRI